MMSEDRFSIYRFFGEDGTLLYVGITNDPEKRIYQHRRRTPWFGEVLDIRYEHFDSPDAASQAEYDAIHREKPLYNRAMYRQRYSRREYQTLRDMTSDTEVLTLKDAGERLGISHVTLRLQAKKGVFGATLAGHQWIVTADEVERYRRENLGKRGNYDHKTAKRKPKESIDD